MTTSHGVPTASPDEKPPVCPGCNEPAKENTYPPGTKGYWWCERCLLHKIQKARRATD